MEGDYIQAKMQSAHPSLCPHPWYVVVVCGVVFTQSRLDVLQLVGPVAPPSVCSLAFFSRAQSTIPPSSLIFLCIGSSCDDPGRCIGSLWERGFSCIIPKTCKVPPFLSCSFLLKWALVSSMAQRDSLPLLSGEVCATQYSSILLPCTVLLLSVETSSRLFHMAVLSATPHKERNCCFSRYGNVQLRVSAKQLCRRGTVLCQVPGRGRCVSCQLLTLPCDISLLIGIVTMRELPPKESIT